MKNQHSTKSISFLMELIFVLLFFTIASAISVFVIVSAKDKSDYATHLRNGLFYGENLIANQEDVQVISYLRKDKFYLDKKGNPKDEPDIYEITIYQHKIDGILHKTQCEMKIEYKGQELTTLSFVMNKGELE